MRLIVIELYKIVINKENRRFYTNKKVTKFNFQFIIIKVFNKTMRKRSGLSWSTATHNGIFSRIATAANAGTAAEKIAY